MKLRRYIPHARAVVFALVGFTAGLYIATGVAALAWGVVFPLSVRMTGTVIAYTSLLGVASLLLVDRRKRERPRAGNDPQNAPAV